MFLLRIKKNSITYHLKKKVPFLELLCVCGVGVGGGGGRGKLFLYVEIIDI